MIYTKKIFQRCSVIKLTPSYANSESSTGIPYSSTGDLHHQ